MKRIGIIPARYASSRFPGKPLIDLAGKSMIQRVYEQCKQATSLDAVVIATDDQRIYDASLAFGARVMMTSTDHQSGTDRCAEVASQLEADVYINIQGDEPLINPKQIDILCQCFEKVEVQIATLVKKINHAETLSNPNTPKVVLDANQNALYFSRAAIPFQRNYPMSQWLENHAYFQHIGIYGYTAQALKVITSLAPGHLEQVESLEQLRWLEAGFSIRTAETDFQSLAIDHPDDVAAVLARL
jgi:3-deoxy-manno-octulosonate cytidylyltransferase (CMP-KDO synthetase)